MPLLIITIGTFQVCLFSIKSHKFIAHSLHRSIERSKEHSYFHSH